jgi:hydroxysqualene dehydroxylase
MAVVGGGWAGLGAAVEGTNLGHAVTLFEMAAQFGGRARAVQAQELTLDNGQHILIGAYTETLRLMRLVGASADYAFVRTPLRFTAPNGTGLQLRAGSPVLAFGGAVARHPIWKWRDKLALLSATARWALNRFRCDEALTVAELVARLPDSVRHELIEPLCVAALNTPPLQASAQVFLRVVADALFAGPGSSDLLLPRVSLSEVFPEPATRWLRHAGATLRTSIRVQQVERSGDAWSVDGAKFDRVVIATPPSEAARLTMALAPDWARAARALHYEPIVTVYLRSSAARLPEPMIALSSNEHRPAQFVFDRGQLGGPAGLLAFVISGAQRWVECGAQAIVDATIAQAQAELGPILRGPLREVQLITEKRATFRCTPRLQRPWQQIAPGLHAAGDYVQGPYPATLEGAVRCAVEAVRTLT